jgi:hypothetical protein
LPRMSLQTCGNQLSAQCKHSDIFIITSTTDSPMADGIKVYFNVIVELLYNASLHSSCFYTTACALHKFMYVARTSSCNRKYTIRIKWNAQNI